MRVLIFSCDTGGGHNSCGEAIKDEFQSRNIDCEVKDALQFVSPLFSKIMSWGHTKIYRYAPKLFGWGYQYSEKHRDIFKEHTIIYKILTLGTDRIYKFIQAEGYDTIICTHVFSALMLTDVLRKYSLNLNTCFVATDYTCSPSCEVSELDVYFIPDSTLIDEFVDCGIPREKLIASGIPVRKAFFTTVDKNIVRKNIDLNPNYYHLLIMSGSMGCGPIENLMKLLSKDLPKDCYISVICGKNSKLFKKLKRIYAKHPQIKIYGFENNISMMMDSADLYMTKPGGISVSEAAVKKLPMVFVNAVAGCETHNLCFFVEQGAAVTADTLEELAILTLSLLSNEQDLNKMSASFRKTISKSPSEIICDYFMEETSI